MYEDTCDPVCFKLGIRLHTTELYSLIPVSMTLMFIQGHRVMGNPELVQYFCCKVVLGNSNVCGGWLCHSKGDDCEAVLSFKCGEYGSFEHLFLFYKNVVIKNSCTKMLMLFVVVIVTRQRPVVPRSRRHVGGEKKESHSRNRRCSSLSPRRTRHPRNKLCDHFCCRNKVLVLDSAVLSG